jgi:hypothetical protein
MGSGPSRFRKTDVTRAVQAVAKTGVSIARVEIAKDGAIAVIPGEPADAPTLKG